MKRFFLKMKQLLAFALRLLVLQALLLLSLQGVVHAQSAIPVIVDTDIGDDIDDAFALALLLNSPEFKILGITATWGNTGLRVQLLERFLRETGHQDIPLAQGVSTTSTIPFSQERWARLGKLPPEVPTAVDFLLEQIRLHPDQITLIAIGPLTNLGTAIERDPVTFRQLKRIVLMGGSVETGYKKSEYAPSRLPDKEYNIISDILAARKLFTSGVPIIMMPLDSTQIKLDEMERNTLFGHGSSMTDALTLLYHQWIEAYHAWASHMPTLYDVVPVAWLIDQRICPTTPLHIVVTHDGFTKKTSGTPNVEVCLTVNKPLLINLFMKRLLQ